MKRTLASIGTVLAIVAATACGDAVAEPGGDAIPVPRTDATAVLPQELPTECPPRSPTENGPCTLAGSTCEFGTSPDTQCNRTYACTPDLAGPFWLERATDPCFKSLCPSVPSDVESLDGQPCALPATDASAPSDADEAVCGMTNGICACTTGADGAHSHERRWICIRPSGGGCPTARPRAGEGCAGNLWCDYGSCKWKRGLLMQCKDDHWLTGGAPCN